MMKEKKLSEKDFLIEGEIVSDEEMADALRLLWTSLFKDAEVSENKSGVK